MRLPHHGKFVENRRKDVFSHGQRGAEAEEEHHEEEEDGPNVGARESRKSFGVDDEDETGTWIGKRWKHVKTRGSTRENMDWAGSTYVVYTIEVSHLFLNG